MRRSEKVLSGSWTGWTGKPIPTRSHRNRGSDMTPYMVTEALSHIIRGCGFICLERRRHPCAETLAISIETTLFIIASKMFTTLGTMTNAIPRASGCSKPPAIKVILTFHLFR